MAGTSPAMTRGGYVSRAAAIARGGSEFPESLPRTERRVARCSSAGVYRRHPARPICPIRSSQNPEEKIMIITAAHITPLVAIIAGILILIMPRLLNYIVAIYLIFIGLVGLNSVHHFINWH